MAGVTAHRVDREDRNDPTDQPDNKSLKRGSIQRLFIPRIKTDLTDDTISLSTLVLKDMNASNLSE